MTVVQRSFTLADITDTDRFRRLGASLAADPDGELAPVRLSAPGSGFGRTAYSAPS
jgi:hypothetical protein